MKSPLILVGLVVLVSSLVAPAAVTVRNHYRMGESDPGAANGGTNPTTRDTVGTNHLTTAGGPTYSNDVGFETAARTGSALSMNFPSGGSRSASGALLANVTDNFGLELWVKTTTASGSHCLAYNGSPGSSGSANRAVKRVLLLEDDPAFGEIMAEFLRESGFEVVAVVNGVEGVHKVLASDFEVILCDMMMPTLPGDMFFRAVERMRPHLCNRFIFMTGHRGNAKVNDFIRNVNGTILSKPFHVDDLLEMIAFVQVRTAVN